jgi:thioredoxin reductase (NADPH)
LCGEGTYDPGTAARQPHVRQCRELMQGGGRVRDVVIVGSGPAGYTAAIYAARAGLDTLVIEGQLPGGALTAAGQMDNYPGFSQPVCGPRLARMMRSQAHRFGAEFHTADVDGFDLEGEVKTIAINDDLRHASALILAMGSANRRLNVPGERELRGNGISFSAKRDGDQFAGREVAVVGGGDAATEEAVFLAALARYVTVIHHRTRLRAPIGMAARLRAQPNVVVLDETEVLAVKGRHHVTGVRVRTARTAADYDINVDAVFVAIGQTPRSDLLIGLVDLDARGYVQTRGQGTHTCVDGVFAAGDLIDRRYRQAVTAAATGCQAALDAQRWLSQSRTATTNITMSNAQEVAEPIRSL